MTIILGSSSKRRKEILDYFSIVYEQKNPLFNEDEIPKNLHPNKFAYTAAEEKSKSLAKEYPNRTILSADTVVYYNDRLILKPKDENDAYNMLLTLSGNWHYVVTAVSVYKDNKVFTETEETKILFNKLSDDQIKAYHKNFYFMDKAGGYAIQKGGSIIVNRIIGCYYNVMGLPINTTCTLLQKVGINLWDHLKPSL